MTYLTQYDIQSFDIDIKNPEIIYGSQIKTACYSDISTKLRHSLTKSFSNLNTYLIIALPIKYPGIQYYAYPEILYKTEFFKKWAEILKENLDLDIEYVEKPGDLCYLKVYLTPYLVEIDFDKYCNNFKLLHKFLLLITTIIRYGYESIQGANPVTKHIVEIYEENKEYVNKSNFFDFLTYVLLSEYNISPNGLGHIFRPSVPYDKFIWKYRGKSLLSKLFKLDSLYSLPSLSNSGNTTFLSTGFSASKYEKFNKDCYSKQIDYNNLNLDSFKSFYDYILNIKQNE